MGKLKILGDVVEGGLNAIKAAGRTAHEQQAAVRATKDAEVAEQMANLPARNKKANEALGLYHPVGGGIKLSKPTRGMHATTVRDPKFNPPEIGIITPEQLVKEEAALFPLVGDRAAGGKYLTHVGENELEAPVRLTGGPLYMDANYNHIIPDESAAWESGLNRVTALGRQAERAGEGGRPVYGIYTAGSGINTDFNIMGANALIQQLPFSKITKKAEKEFDRAMREGSKEFAAIPNWPGIRSPEAQEMLLDKSNGIVRTKLFGTMGKENFQSMGFPDVPATRKAIIEPELLDVPTNQAGFRMARMDTKGRIIEDPLIPSDYPKAMAGKVVGKLDVPADYKDVFQSHFDARRLLGQPESGDYYSFSRAHPIQYADDAWLNRLMEQRFANERKIKEGEYKKGGAVEDFDSKVDKLIEKHHFDNHVNNRIEEHFAKGGMPKLTRTTLRMGKGGLLGKGAKALVGAVKAAEVVPAAEKVIVQQAPSIIIPSKVSNVKEAVRQSKGDYGARRVERAADEIPNLERMYQEDALKQAFTGDNAAAMMTIDPSRFEEFATPIGSTFTRPNSVRHTSAGDRVTFPEYLDYLKSLEGFDDVPFLEINKQLQGTMAKPYISGHEGRHRNRAMSQSGEKAGLVQLLPRSELREPFPRRTQEEYIEALKKELEMTGNIVLPQINKNQPNLPQRPAIDLPDIYATGGVILKHKTLRNRKTTQSQPIRLAEGGITLARTSLRRMKDGGKPEATVQATPRKKGYGTASDVLKGVHEFVSKPFGYDNPPAEMLSDFIGIPAASRVLDKLSYGEPITNYGKANVPLIPDDTFDAAGAGLGGLGAASKLAKPLAKAAKKLPKDLPVGLSIKAVGDIPTGAGSLSKAEREAGFQKFIDKSAEKRRMYHGSKEPNITEFKTRKEMTDPDNMTGHYADERDAVFLSPEPEFTTHFSKEGYTDTHQAPTTYPVYVQVERPFDFDNPEHLKKVKETYLDMYHNPESEFYDPSLLASERSTAQHLFNKRVDALPEDQNNWGRIENPEFQEILKDLGFDSFYTRERGTKNLGVYEPNRIKSAIGNRGTYDIRESDINKARGGAILKHTTLRRSKANQRVR